jgi:hypothetical protein
MCVLLSVFAVDRRMRILSVRITVLYPPVSAVLHDLDVLASRRIAGGV